MIGGAGGTPWYKVKTPPIYFHDTGADILLGNNFLKKMKQENFSFGPLLSLLLILLSPRSVDTKERCAA